METTTLTQSNYINDYSALQLSLPIDLGLKIESDDEVVSFLKAIEGVNLKKFLVRKERRGRKGYDNVKLLKAVLFARMNNVSETRKIAALCRHDIRFMYIMNEERPRHMAFERLLVNYLQYDIDYIFFEVTNHIASEMSVDRSAQHIDGTKVESYANRYSFVYKKRILNARRKLFTKISEAILELNAERGFSYPCQSGYCAQEIGYIAQYLMEIMVNEEVEIVYGKGKRKEEVQRWYDLFLGFYIKLNEYEYWLNIIGEERNSCSKTDHDATMCATKMDYYCNTGLSRPCYNAQIAVSEGIIVNADLYQRPADTKTFIPFMERYYEYNGEYPRYPMADAAYGSYDNYMYCLKNGMELVMKYPMYARKKEAKYKKQTYNPANWETDEEGYKVCPEGKKFDQYLSDRIDESGNYPRIIQRLTSQEDCSGCPRKSECCKSGRKILSRDVVLNEFYQKVDENLSTEYGKELKKQRSIQAEGAFGVIKEDMKFTRFTRRGLKNAKMEFLLVCLGYNLKKFHQYRLKKQKNFH